jgi:hypothetical protein
VPAAAVQILAEGTHKRLEMAAILEDVFQNWKPSLLNRGVSLIDVEGRAPVTDFFLG